MITDREIVIHPSGKLDLLNFLVFAGLLALAFLVTGHLAFSYEALLIVTVIGGLYFSFGVVERLFSFYKVSHTELVARYGLFQRQIVKIPIARIENYEVLQSVSGRVVGICDVVIDTTGRSDPELIIKNLDVHESQRFLQLLDKAIDGHAAAGQFQAAKIEKSRSTVVAASNF